MWYYRGFVLCVQNVIVVVQSVLMETQCVIDMVVSARVGKELQESCVTGVGMDGSISPQLAVNVRSYYHTPMKDNVLFLCFPAVCACDTVGSISSVCDELTSQCDCQPNVQGLDCDICNLGFFNLTSTGCSDCDCSQFSFSDQCSETGQCPCLNGIGGSTCNQCMPGFYNLSSTGCTACNCTSVGERSSLNDCDVEIGQCQCIGNTVGRDCSQCPGGYYEAQNPLMDVCIECVCSKKTTDCTDGSDEFLAAAWVSDFQQLCQDNPVNCNDDWDLLTASGVSAGPFGPRYVYYCSTFPQLPQLSITSCELNAICYHIYLES